MRQKLLALIAAGMSATVFCADRVKPAPPGAVFGPTVEIPDPFGLRQQQGRVGMSTNAPDALGAVPRRDKRSDKGSFMARHKANLQRAREGPIGLLFLGDSITEGWVDQPALWHDHYGRFAPANFGIGADETQHLLWRIEDGELDAIRPKVIVLLIGTHNTRFNTAPQIAAGTEKILRTIQKKLPGTRVLLLGVFPRGFRDDDGDVHAGMRMTTIRSVNGMLATLDDGKDVRFLDVGARFLGSDGKLLGSMFVDQLHLSEKGFEVWASAMQPLMEDMMK